MSSSVKFHTFNTEKLAQLFLSLWQMEEAGVPCIEAINILKNQAPDFKNQLTALQQRLKSGSSIAETGFRVGLFNDIQKTLIHAGESSGCLSTVYKQLADYYQQKASRERQVKARLYLPIFILTVALFVQPLPELVGARISAIEYLQMTAGRLFLILTGGLVFLRLPFWLTEGFLSGFKQTFNHLQLQIPGVCDWVIARQVNEFLFMLGMMLEAGLPFAQALPQAVAGIKNTALRKQFNLALSGVNQGESVSELLAKVSVIKSSTLQIINTGEQSGQLAESILRLAKLEAETIQLQNEMLAEWLPRLVYLLVALWMAYSILRQWMLILNPIQF